MRIHWHCRTCRAHVNEELMAARPIRTVVSDHRAEVPREWILITHEKCRDSYVLNPGTELYRLVKDYLMALDQEPVAYVTMPERER